MLSGHKRKIGLDPNYSKTDSKFTSQYLI